jgi:hypothetical protein
MHVGFHFREHLAASAALKAPNLGMAYKSWDDMPQPHRLLARRAVGRGRYVTHDGPNKTEACRGFNSGKARRLP